MDGPRKLASCQPRGVIRGNPRPVRVIRGNPRGPMLNGPANWLAGAACAQRRSRRLTRPLLIGWIVGRIQQLWRRNRNPGASSPPGGLGISSTAAASRLGPAVNKLPAIRLDSDHLGRLCNARSDHRRAGVPTHRCDPRKSASRQPGVIRGNQRPVI
jgi:hypothetical protein